MRRRSRRLRLEVPNSRESRCRASRLHRRTTRSRSTMAFPRPPRFDRRARGARPMCPVSGTRPSGTRLSGRTRGPSGGSSTGNGPNCPVSGRRATVAVRRSEAEQVVAEVGSQGLRGRRTGRCRSPGCGPIRGSRWLNTTTSGASVGFVRVEAQGVLGVERRQLDPDPGALGECDELAGEAGVEVQVVAQTDRDGRALQW